MGRSPAFAPKTGRLSLKFKDQEEVVIALPDGQTGTIKIQESNRGSCNLVFLLPKDWVVIRPKLKTKTAEESVLAGTAFGGPNSNL